MSSFTGGSLKLKLKGTETGTGVVKKKKKSLKSTTGGTTTGSTGGSTTGTTRETTNSTRETSQVQKTKNELNQERIQRERLDKKIENLAEKSHKDRVNDFNKYLSRLSEHHDIPRVGPG